jgi:ferredoxin
MKPLPALHRVVPAHGTVKSEWILPYDDIKAIILSGTSFTAGKCICRAEQDALGRRKCAFPLRNCLGISRLESQSRPDAVSREEALAILDQAEEAGLVHTVSNVVHGLSYVCNCCGCCCAILRGITEYGIEGSVARASYRSRIDAELCTACGACAERCQVGAIEEKDGSYAVRGEKCIGCGLCVTGCPADAASLERLPDGEILRPPEDYPAWERERLMNRGLSRSV